MNNLQSIVAALISAGTIACSTPNDPQISNGYCAQKCTLDLKLHNGHPLPTPIRGGPTATSETIGIENDSYTRIITYEIRLEDKGILIGILTLKFTYEGQVIHTQDSLKLETSDKTFLRGVEKNRSFVALDYLDLPNIYSIRS